jgi:hypothetical protein
MQDSLVNLCHLLNLSGEYPLDLSNPIKVYRRTRRANQRLIQLQMIFIGWKVRVFCGSNVSMQWNTF